MTGGPSPGVPRFPTTRWSLVRCAAGELSADQRAALNELLTVYWPLLRSRLIAGRGIDANQADDLLQSFIQQQVLQGKLLSVANPSRGRFRNLLYKALNNFVAKHIRSMAARKRRVNLAAGLDRENEHLAVWSVTPSRHLDGIWARETLAVVLERMRDECQHSGRDDIWGVFEARILAPILNGAAPLSYHEIAQRYHYASTTQAQNALVTAKRSFCRLMRDILLEAGTAPDEVDAEIGELRQCLAAY